MSIPLETGLEWEDDPAGNAHSHDGRTLCRDVIAKGDASTRMLVKRPKAQHMDEMYSIGMERVAYSLATLLDLDLPVLPTYLENIDGHLCSLTARIVNARSWRQRPWAMKQQTVNESVFPAAAMFDVWLANVDRRDVNLLFEARPEGRKPGTASGAFCYLIDHGHCGLFPGGKFGRAPTSLPAASEVTGEMIEKAEIAIGAVMPPEYRMPLKSLTGTPRDKLLDAIRSVRDDDIRQAVDEVPDGYMTKEERDATVAFLQVRRNQLDTVLQKYW